MSTLRQYELIYIVSPSATDEGVAELHTQVEAIVGKFDGRIEKTENWGKRRLAYEVNHCKEGTYVLELLLGSGEMVTELERRLRVAEDVLRHLVVRVDEELHIAERTTTRRAETRKRRRGARGLPPESPAPQTPVKATAEVKDG